MGMSIEALEKQIANAQPSSGGNWWKPKREGDTIAGEVIRAERIAERKVGKKTYAAAWGLEIKTRKGPAHVRLKTVMESELTRRGFIDSQKGAKVGYLVGFKFCGRPKGKNYDSFAVVTSGEGRFQPGGRAQVQA